MPLKGPAKVIHAPEPAALGYCQMCIRDSREGGRILIDDGLIELKIQKVSREDIVCQVVNGGRISDRKGINVPDVSLSMPFLSERDRQDIIFGIETGFDFIAASFTRTAEDIMEIRRLLKRYGGEHVRIIAKIENGEGVSNLDEIVRVSDGIMVARGDMGVEISFEHIPVPVSYTHLDVYKRQAL